METLLVSFALVFIAGAGIVVYRNKRLQKSLTDFAKELQANSEILAAEKKIAANLKAKATEEIVKEVKKVTKKK
jgi:hypothetical protein